MKSTRKTRKPVSAEAIARMADKGEDISRFFKNDFKMMPPLIQRVNVDFAAPIAGGAGPRGERVEHQPSGGDQNARAAGAGSAVYGGGGTNGSEVTRLLNLVL